MVVKNVQMEIIVKNVTQDIIIYSKVVINVTVLAFLALLPIIV